jgi:hypothetical protein
MPFSIRLEGNHAPFEAAARRKLLWLSRDDDNRLKMNSFHEGLGANPRRSWLNSRNGKIRHHSLADNDANNSRSACKPQQAAAAIVSRIVAWVTLLTSTTFGLPI